MQKSTKVILISLLFFGAYFILDEWYFRDLRAWLDGFFQQIIVSHIIAYFIFGIPILAGSLVLHGRRLFIESLGLDKSIWKGAAFALICTLPMFVGFAIVFDFNSEISWASIWLGVIAAGFFEELYFRGFLFGQVFRYSRLGFIPAVLLGALLFGFVHIYQGNSWGESAGIFMITFMGGVLFAWIYAEWDFNLWTSIFLHLFMNLSWGLFSVGSNALGGMYGNIFRTLTIAAAIILTILYKRRKGLPMMITRKTLLLKPPNWDSPASG